MNELPIPPQVRDAKKAMELARIWIADGDQQIILSSNLWDDPAAWGLMLVDLARHISKAYAVQGRDESVVLERIKKAFEAEYNSPTD